MNAGSGVPWHEVARRLADVLPRDPHTDPRARLVEKPGPPRLAEADRARWPLRLARSYRSAVAEWFGKCQHKPGKFGDPCEGRFCGVGESLDAADVGQKTIDLLRRAGDLLFEAKIPPVSWAAFSCAMWTAYGPRPAGKRKTRPPLANVYSAARIERRGGFANGEPLRPGMVSWFDWHERRFAAARVEMLYEHRVVFSAWDRLRAKLGCEPGASAQRAQDLVRECFPPDWYAAAVEKIERARNKVEEDWRWKAGQDRWLWDR